ncbi:MAG: ATP-binding cassette domain-containing protein [Bradymonadaceae bacterium]
MIKCFHLSVSALHDGSPIFDDLLMEVAPRSWVEVCGPPSSGKSLLFSILAVRMLAPRGKLIIGGRNLDRLKAGGYAELRQSMGTCSQNPELLLGRTAMENLVVPLVVRKKADDAAHKALVLLEAVGREALRDVPILAMSQEDRQLIAVLRALIGHPSLILIDGSMETFEPDLRETLVGLLDAARDKGGTIILFSREPTPERPDDALWYTIAHGKLHETTLQEISVEEVAS